MAYWIKIEKDTLHKPELRAIARELGIHPHHVLGSLIHVWDWFDSHTEDGGAIGETEDLVNELAGHPDFAQAMAAVGWLGITEHGLRLPKFGRHNGQTSKQRCNANRRKAASRVKTGRN
jgi:hypothetical protein